MQVKKKRMARRAARFELHVLVPILIHCVASVFFLDQAISIDASATSARAAQANRGGLERH